VVYNHYSCNGSVSASLSPPSGLSTGAKAGIGAGAGVGGSILIACIAAGIVHYRRKRARKAAQAKVAAGAGIAEKGRGEVEAKEIPAEESPPELHGREAGVVETRPELDGVQGRVAEVHSGDSNFSSPLSAELDSRAFPVEMPP
jgi:hypothetical protein